MICLTFLKVLCDVPLIVLGQLCTILKSRLMHTLFCLLLKNTFIRLKIINDKYPTKNVLRGFKGFVDKKICNWKTGWMLTSSDEFSLFEELWIILIKETVIPKNNTVLTNKVLNNFPTFNGQVIVLPLDNIKGVQFRYKANNRTCTPPHMPQTFQTCYSDTHLAL